MNKTIRRGSRIVVIAGNDKGKTGEVLSCRKNKVLVQGINMRKKHLKRTQESQGGRIIDMEVPIHISNVCLCDSDGTRLKKTAKAAPQDNPAEIAAPKKKATKTLGKKTSSKKVKDV